MVLEKIVNKLLVGISMVSLSGFMGCASMQKDVRADLTGQEIGCETLQQNGGKSFQCGHLTYDIVNSAEYGGMITNTYQAVQDDKTYTMKTDQMTDESCIYAMEIQGPKGKPIKLFFNKCKQMK